MTNNLTGLFKQISIWGWVILIAGILAVIVPMIAGGFIIIMVGSIMLVAGVIRIVHALQHHEFWNGLFGLIYCVAGFMIVADPLPGLLALTMLLVIYFLAVGITEIIAAFQIRPEQGWAPLLFSGVVSVLLAIMIWNQWPLSGTWAVGVLVGVQLIFSGMAMITVGSAGKQMSESSPL
ncbi:MAG: DUF308 domain-containing protein [Pseudomonadales bacterium]|nr:DUF308 domain-containing protein [Pseudomonadales bacterium]